MYYLHNRKGTVIGSSPHYSVLITVMSKLDPMGQLGYYITGG